MSFLSGYHDKQDDNTLEALGHNNGLWSLYETRIQHVR